MALIKCPECGRENVSSTAESCPNCGYGIKAHFDRIEKQKAEQEKRQFIENARKVETETRYNEYKSEVRQKQIEIDKIKEPVKPNFFVLLFRDDVRFLSFLILIGPILTLIFCMFAQVDFFLLILYIAIGLLASPIWLIINYLDYRKEIENYKKEFNLYKSNKQEWEKQQEQKKANIEAWYRMRAANDVEKKYNTPVQINKIKCPNCGSANIDKITTVDRSFSVAMVGLASGKIGKQYKCKNCKHMW